ncbi:MAG TPA: hypothetical protein VH184_19535 [Dongiaceae bacterium]|nr:hypothetical protein [Dongiaceae bacterium]
MATRPDCILPKSARAACWILSGLLFYALYTRALLADVAILGQENDYFSSAWTALGDAVWQNPNSIAVIAEHSNFDRMLWTSAVLAAIGTLPLVILALARKRPLVGFVLLLSILPASLVVIVIAVSIGYETYNNDLLFRSDAWFVANANLEIFLGFIVPAIIYALLFCGTVFYLIRWFVLRRRAIWSAPSHDPLP